MPDLPADTYHLKGVNNMKKKLVLSILAVMMAVVVLLAAGCSGNTDTTEPDDTRDTDVATSSGAPDDPDVSSSPGTNETGPGTNDDDTSNKPAQSTPEDDTDSTSENTPEQSNTEKPDDTDKPDNTEPPQETEQTTKPDETTEDEPVVEPPEGTKINVKYVVNNSDAGGISGKTSQTVLYGQTVTSIVTANPKLGYKFVGWSDGNTSQTRKGECPTESVTYTAIFEYDFLELPVISLRTDSGLDITDKINYVSGTISIYNAPDRFCFEDLPMEIRGRGNYTWGSTFNPDPMYNKRPYRIKLSEKMNLLGNSDGTAKIYTLIANHCDQSLLRNQISMGFAKSLTGIVWEPSATSVEVFLNGNYIGVYMLADQVHVQESRINLSEDYESSSEIDFLIHRSGYAEYPSFNIDGEPYEVVNDLSENPSLASMQLQYISNRIAECWNAVKRGSQEEVEKLIDLDSVVDVYIVHELFKNLDTGWDNFYMFAETDGKLFFGPTWDFDQCAGNANEGVENYQGLRGSLTNAWFRLFLSLDWFKELVVERWDELYDEICDIPDTIRETAQSAYNSYCRNFDKWQIWGYQINRETEVIRSMHTYKEHYEYFAEWMANRAVWLNSYYHSPEFISQPVKNELEGNGTVSSPYLIENAEDFYNLYMLIQSGETFSGSYFKQTADIDMTTINYYSGLTSQYTFAGVYNGNGHTIHAELSGGSDNCIFPYVSGTIMNLITTGSINNSGITGGIARSVREGGLIFNCGSTMTLTTTGNAGGIVPSNQTNGGDVIGCWFAGKINAMGSFGPINIYFDGRKGTFVYNYYCDDFCNPEVAENANTRPDAETAITRDQLASLHENLNKNLASAARAAGISTKDVCSWTVKDGIPSMISK